MKHISHDKIHRIIDSCTTMEHTDFVEKYIQLYDKQLRYKCDNMTYLMKYSFDIIHTQLLIFEKSYKIRTKRINEMKQICTRIMTKKGYIK